jgi:hypothetical protein
MPSLRVWILAVAVGAFAAGGVVGHVFAGHATSAEAATEEAAYADDLAQRYGLDAETHRRLRLVMHNFATRQIAILKSAPLHLLPSPQNHQMQQLNRTTEQYVRALLDDEQRDRYDRESRPLGQPASAEKR